MNPLLLIRATALKEWRQQSALYLIMALIWMLNGTGEIQRALLQSISLILAVYIGNQIIHSEYTNRSWGFVLTRPIAREWLLLLKFFCGLIGMLLAMCLGAIILKWVMLHLPWPSGWKTIVEICFPMIAFKELVKECGNNAITYTFAMMIGLWQPWSFRKFRHILAWMSLSLISIFCYLASKDWSNLNWGDLNMNDWILSSILSVMAFAASLGLIKELQIKE